MHRIVVEEITSEPWEFQVTVDSSDGEGECLMIMDSEEYERYNDELEPAELVKATIRFLLDRVELDDLPEEIHVSEIEKKYPDFPEAIVDYA
jgi:hypothetical protein